MDEKARRSGRFDEEDVVRFHEIFGDILPGDPGDYEILLGGPGEYEGTAAASAEESGMPWWKRLRWWEVLLEGFGLIFALVLGYVWAWFVALVFAFALLLPALAFLYGAFWVIIFVS